LRVEAHEGGVYPEPTLAYRVVHCFHCQHPACADACPSDAVAKGADGYVRVSGELCVGCAACVDACPFGAVSMLPSGVASMCDGCRDEIAAGWAPTCVRACPMRALDIADHGSSISIRRRSMDGTFDDRGIRPRVVYLT
jgi:anaerobic dimethyl sulfoxide reductase subunit B (iron-sulfur subunit)